MTKRELFLGQLAEQITQAHFHKILRVGINGVDGSGKTRLADELEPLLEAKGATVIRASIDGFHNPRVIRYAKGRTSPEGFYQDSYNFTKFKNLLLKPLSPNGNLHYKSAAFDHVTDSGLDMPFTKANFPAILLVDGIFLFNGILKDYFDLKIFLDVPFDISCARMAVRDGSVSDPLAAENRRYVEGQKLYMAECNPQEQADILVDYSDLTRPHIL